jgi:predicted DNA-binding transcriptional regulator AlpA
MTIAATTPTAPSAAPVLLPLRTFLKIYAISKSEFYRLAARGEAPEIAKIGRRTLIPAASAAAWLQSRIVPAVTLSRSAGGAA